MADDASRPIRRRRRLLIGALGVLLAVLLAGVVGFLWWAQPQPLLPEATAALASTPGASFRQGEDGRLEWTPTAAEPTTGLVLYTGGKVPASRVCAGRTRHRRGGLPRRHRPGTRSTSRSSTRARHRRSSTTTRRSRHGPSAATRSVARRRPSSSTGTPGSSTAWSCGRRTRRPTSPTTASSCRAATARWTRPPRRSPDPANIAKLGPAVVLDAIEGGNHEQMGWYTGQPNDPPATISRQDQQDRIVAATIELLRTIEGA